MPQFIQFINERAIKNITCVRLKICQGNATAITMVPCSNLRPRNSYFKAYVLKRPRSLIAEY